MDTPSSMETNKWLWQPKKTGPIFLRIVFRDLADKRREFVRSLRTQRWPEARRIRDAEFMPIILDMEKAKAQVELALALYPELLQQLQQGKHGGYADRTPSPALPLGALMQEWLKALSTPGSNYASSAGTAKRYAAIGTLFVRYFGAEREVTTLTTADLAAYRDARLVTYRRAKQTVRLEMATLRGLFAYAAERHGLPANPADGVSVKRSRAERNREGHGTSRRPPTHEEADQLCTAFPGAKGHYPIADYQDYAAVARYTGMRQAEIAALRASDLRVFPAGEYGDAILRNPAQYSQVFDGTPTASGVVCIFVRDDAESQTKTGLQRIVPVADKLLPVVQRRLAAANGGHLFPFAVADKGATFGRDWLKKAKRIHQELTMHGFRHYATSQMENNGANPAVSRIILGHVTGEVHDQYYHRTIGSLKAAVDLIY